MLAKRIIPCLDVTAGRVVKGVNFVNLRDAGDPVELAERYNQQGADELVFLDITASSDARDIMADVVARTARGNVVHTEPKDMYLSRVAAINGGCAEGDPGADLQCAVHRCGPFLCGLVEFSTVDPQ